MNIVEIVKSYGVELEKKGQLYIGFCPFHDDQNTPNLTIYPASNSFYCYSCMVGGGVLNFIALIEDKPMKEIKERYGMMVWQDNIKKVTGHVVDYKSEILILAANAIREYLKYHPENVDIVMGILKKFDAKLYSMKELTYLEGTALIAKLRNFMEGIGGDSNESLKNV